MQHNVAWDEAYLRAKFNFDPSNHLATIRQCHRQDRQTDRTGQQFASIGRTVLQMGRPKIKVVHRINFVKVCKLSSYVNNDYAQKCFSDNTIIISNNIKITTK